MAYNSKKGVQKQGDIHFEGDPEETQIDFEDDSIKLKTGGSYRLEVNNNHVSASGNISGSAYYGDGSTLTSVVTGVAGPQWAVQFQNYYNDLAGTNLFTYYQPTETLTVKNVSAYAGYVSASTSLSASVLRVSGTTSIGTSINSTHFSSSLNVSGAAFYGDGSTLSGLTTPAIVSYGNSGQYRVVIGSTASDAINAATNLTFNTTTNKLAVTGDVSASLGVSGSSLHASNNATGVGTVINGTHFSSSLNVSGAAFYGDGTTLTGIVTGPPGNDTELLYNDLGAFGTSANLKFDNATNILTVTGAISLSGSSRSSFQVRNDAGAYSIVESDNVIIFNNAANRTGTLPQITTGNQGITFYVKNINSGELTLTGSEGYDQFIDGQQTLLLSQGDCAKVIGHHIGVGFGWAILSYYNV